MSTHELLGHEIEMDLDEDEIVTGLVVIVCTDTMDGGPEGLRFRYSIPTGRIKADGMIFNAYHASAAELAPEDD
ncbi:hypothetical protein GKZ75_08495 [Kocuria indica]|uniref:Uncharacterized protein n=1 Tax=Kocuria marina subsp. indica TaxID=1049583 RepID=A0A6N9R115_9MICC|nr:hypothetical protein [Kocuria indica]NDO78260.1 hypothetical protein [Kocuria indica]